MSRRWNERPPDARDKHDEPRHSRSILGRWRESAPRQTVDFSALHAPSRMRLETVRNDDTAA